MGIFTSILRLTVYLKRNGRRATARRAALAVNRSLFSNRMILFYCDLSAQNLPPASLPNSLTVERKRSESELDPQDMQVIVNFWNPKLVRRKIKERFRQGASLWMIKSGGRLAGYGWTLQGRTVEPHYFRLGKADVHLFDFLIFRQYRGHGLNSLLVAHILHNAAAAGALRSFIEAAEWNHAQLSSLRKTSFRRMGQARKLTIFGYTIVCWDEAEMPGEEAEEEKDRPYESISSQKSSHVSR